MRLFVAIALPEDVRARLAELAGRLAAVAEPRVKWVEARNLHLTVKFLGEAGEDRLPAIAAALDRAAAGSGGPIEARVRGAGAFPDPRRPRVLWTSVAAGPALPALVERVEREVSPLGFPREDRPWSPHLTLGRVKAPRAAPALAAALAREAGFDGGPLRIDRLTLYRSELSREGPTYTVVHEAALG